MDVEKINSIFQQFGSEYEGVRQGALAGLLSTAASQGIDLRDLRLTINTPAAAAPNGKDGWSEFRAMMRAAYPEESKLQDEIDLLRAENRELQLKLRTEREQSREPSDKPLVALLKAALLIVANSAYVQPMTKGEMQTLVEATGRNYHEYLKEVRYDPGAATVANWLRVLVRCLRPADPPRAPRKKHAKSVEPLGHDE